MSRDKDDEGKVLSFPFGRRKAPGTPNLEEEVGDAPSVDLPPPSSFPTPPPLPDPPGADEDTPAPDEALVDLDTLAAPAPDFVQAAVEAVLFASDKPLSLAQLRSALGDVRAGLLRGALANLAATLEDRNAGIRLVEVAGGWQLRTVPRAATYVAAVLGTRPTRLSKAAIETLAIVAYRQPVTRQEVEDIRGVDAGGMLRSLLEKRLLTVMGRKEEAGRPLIYGTSPEFLSLYGLRDLSDLPTLRDLRELREDDPSDATVQPELFDPE
ncbi:MAG: SMC-Scp complex subunit ScpB [Myxococcota bacterium]|nr:SMC-Scp complex subunit ScpB [Myxococcota bacterium]